MTSIENKINQILPQDSKGDIFGCESWPWLSPKPLPTSRRNPFPLPRNKIPISPFGLDHYPWDTIHKIIQAAETAECLTSQSEYVRECKKWINTHGNLVN